MRGKAIDQVTFQDLTQLVNDGVAEDRRIEFKADLPVSAEQQKAQLKLSSAARPVDRSWTHGNSLAKFGRDALAEEVVAFANADGGTLILGMEETDEAPPRAKGINPLPDVAGLERRLRDSLASCIEPRLPYVAVRALPTTADGSGVILIETGPSVLGPHWVTYTRKPTIRREDRCDPLSMPEVHDMVLRHARQIDSYLSKSHAERTAFVQAFAAYFRSKKPDNYLGEDSRIFEVWLRQTGQAALGAQVTLTPHFDLAIPRLESMAGLVPSPNAISLVANSQPRSTDYVDVYSYASGNAAKVLGGMKADQSGGFDKKVRVMRDGRVTVSFMQIRSLQACTCSADLIIGASGFVLGVYDRLRRRSSYPAAPADLTLDICTRGHVGVGDYEGAGPHGSYGRLAEHTPFPSYTLGDAEDISELLQEISADLMNAGGMPASHLPKAMWHDPQ
jgi:hypothetical protein